MNFQSLFNYLYQKDEKLEPADLVIGFGHFDPKIPEKCVELYHENLADKILFTGGIGAGTADLEMPEADFFKQVALDLGILEQDIMVENQSTNTAENILFSEKTLNKHKLSFSQCESVLLVMNAYRARRVYHTFELHYPKVNILMAPPETEYETEKKFFSRKNEDLDQHLKGEIDRLLEYPKKGWISHVEVPEKLQKA
mgnify:CR=1 FL=1